LHFLGNWYSAYRVTSIRRPLASI